MIAESLSSTIFMDTTKPFFHAGKNLHFGTVFHQCFPIQDQVSFGFNDHLIHISQVVVHSMFMGQSIRFLPKTLHIITNALNIPLSLHVNKDLLEKAKGMPWQEALVARAHFHDLLDRGVELEEVQKTASKDEYELKSVLSDLFNNEISEETFAEAYMRGVKRSGASDYDEERLTRYGKQFLKDFMLRLSDEDQEKDIEEALILLGAMGSLYCGDSK